ncbi:MAG: glycosyltransferase family 4 protein [Chlamydiae bacterium]|nr:glycosyltransferase family 4 protein [Chlamydiota bacterium]MBI3276599.1 glycosyltransferase family 4 protein [Chlamydiota bacterium]
MNLKILMIAPTPFFADRGCHVRIYEEIKALQSLGAKITLCTYSLGRDIKGLDIRRSSKIPWYHKLEAGPSWHKFYLDLFLYWKAKKILKKEHHDLIHAHLHEGVLIANRLKKKFGIPVVGDFQGSLTDEIKSHGFTKNPFLLKSFSFSEQRINQMPDFSILSSFQLQEKFQQESKIQSKIFSGQTSVISDALPPSPASPSPFFLCKLKEKLGIPKNAQVITYLGLLNTYQGIDLLMEMMPKIIQKIEKVHFLIMGYPNEKKYEKICYEKNLQNHVTWTGRISYEEITHYLALGDIAISPKISQTEGNGKLMNYMAMGLPTVVFDTGVNREILGELGVYAAFPDSDDFCNKVVDLLKDSPRREKLRPLLKERANTQFLWNERGNQIIQIYRRVLASQAPLKLFFPSLFHQIVKILIGYFILDYFEVIPNIFYP